MYFYSKPFYIEKIYTYFFNKIIQDVLSTISGQVYLIQEALRTHSNRCLIAKDKYVTVNQNSALFITMNPADKKYGGRQQLPDNLKQLFRPVLMSVPDNTLISEILLFSEGFKNAKNWAIKLNTLYDFSK